MKKTIIISILTLMQLISYAQSYKASVKEFKRYSVKSSIYEKIDTTVLDRSRLIEIEEGGYVFSIGFPVDGQIIHISYKVSKRSVANYDKRKWICYLGGDSDGFPLVLYISDDGRNAMLYYFYTNSIRNFSKSEYMDINK